MTIKIVAFVSVKSGKEDHFLAAARTCIAASRAESGLLQYDLWREIEGERRFVYNELYTDRDAVQSHAASAHVKAFGVAVADLFASPPEVILAEAVDVAD